MSRDELIALGKTIAALANAVELFNRSVPHPDGASLFFYPERQGSRLDRELLRSYDPSVEEVVDRALSYVPIRLGHE